MRTGGLNCAVGDLSGVAGEALLVPGGAGGALRSEPVGGGGATGLEPPEDGGAVGDVWAMVNCFAGAEMVLDAVEPSHDALAFELAGARAIAAAAAITEIFIVLIVVMILLLINCYCDLLLQFRRAGNVSRRFKQLLL